jgi:hypothetical protein
MKLRRLCAAGKRINQTGKYIWDSGLFEGYKGWLVAAPQKEIECNHLMLYF